MLCGTHVDAVQDAERVERDVAGQVLSNQCQEIQDDVVEEFRFPSSHIHLNWPVFLLTKPAKNADAGA